MNLYFPILSLALVLFLYTTGLYAQTALISEKQIPLQTYPFSDPNPVPEQGNIYPYFRYDGFSDKGTMRNWKMIELENDYIKLWVSPEIGGKIWGAIEKATGKEFVYYNHAVKFRDVAMRGPWTSGGIELNFGVIGHAPTCSTPVDYLIRENKDGSVSCFVGAIDLPSHTRWSVEINLPKDKAYFTTRSVWDNPTGQEQSYYHWMNLGVKTAGKLEYVFPGAYHLGHEGNHSPWPLDEQGHNISFYENNNFGSYKSYHVFGEVTGFYGAYWHNDDFGFVHYSPYDEKPGKKVWIWGLSDQGMIWEKLLTDSDGQYTEIQSGRLFNQAAGKSSQTPFKNRGFAAGSTDQWTEHWFPVKGTRGLKNALPVGSVNLEQQDGKINVWFCPNELVNAKLEARCGKEVVFSKEINSIPMQGIAETFEYKGDYKNLTVWLGNELLFDANCEKYAVKRPVDSPSGFNWETAYGHYLKGKEQERQRLYKTATEEYQKSLKIDPWFVPALTGMANLAYRKTNYLASLEYSLKALSVDTYDPEANMAYGLAGLALGDTVSAIDGFSIASANVSVRSAAYNALASVFLNQGNSPKALDYADKSLTYNQLGVEGTQLKILCLRKLGLQKETDNQLAKLEEKDPLNHFIRFERFIVNPSLENKTLVQKYITNELPNETYLEYALWYFRNGQSQDALNVLEIAPENHPVVLLWKAYLNHLSGKEQDASFVLNKAIQQNPQLVFPFRAETLKPLEWAQTHSDSWKLKYYTGLIYLNAGDEEKGRSLWNSCKDVPDFYPFYIARSQLVDTGNQEASSDIEHALSLAGSEWRTGLYASKLYFGHRDTLKALELARSFYGKYTQNYYLGLHYAKMLAMNKKYSACIGLLQKINVLPNEGSVEGRAIWRSTNIGNALYWMNVKKYHKALECIHKAKQWPENLGVGKPYEVDERIEDFLEAECWNKKSKTEHVEELHQKILNFTEQKQPKHNSTDYLYLLILKNQNSVKKTEEFFCHWTKSMPDDPMLKWCKYMINKDMDAMIQKEKLINSKIGDTPWDSQVADPEFELVKMIGRVYKNQSFRVHQK